MIRSSYENKKYCKMRILLFDTETTGLPPSKRKLDPTTWPHIVQLSYLIIDTETFEVIKEYDAIVRVSPDVVISEGSIALHKITPDISQDHGIDIRLVMDEFYADVLTVQKVVAHNLEFDLNVVKVELMRLDSIEGGYRQQRLLMDSLMSCNGNAYCTMLETIYLCNLERKYKNGETYKKYPKLIELYRHLFNEEAANLHNAMNDVVVTLRCYMKLTANIDINDIEEMRHLLKRIS